MGYRSVLRAAIQCAVDAGTVDGHCYDNHYSWVVRFRDGRLIELTEYMDTELVRSALGPFNRRVIS